MIIDRDYEERLYSTGSDELDELLERAFCEGYEYAQYEFSKEDDIRKDIYLEEKRNKAEKKRKTAKGLGIAAGVVGGAGLATAGTGFGVARKNKKKNAAIIREGDAVSRSIGEQAADLRRQGANAAEVQRQERQELDRLNRYMNNKLRATSKKYHRGSRAVLAGGALATVGTGLGIGALAANSKKKKLRREISQLEGK